jgi:PEP-CTERM motif-containing protein
MKRTLLITLIGLTIVATSLFAQTSQTLSISGPSNWVPGTTVTLSVQDAFSGYLAYGLSYWLMVSNAIAPSLTITSVTYFTFPDGNNIGTFPFSFNSTSGADPGFMTTTTANGQSGDLGATANGPMQPPPPGLPLHVTDINFAIAANAPFGTYTLRTTTASPRGSIQVTSDFGDAPFPQASFVFSVVPEPSTLALITLTSIGAGVMAYRRRKS